jgi:signal transduction histidine kinase
LADLLDFTEMEAGRLTLRSAPFDPYEMLTALEQTFRPKAQAKGLLFELEVGNLPRILLGDSHRLGQILRDLTSNAVKFTDSGLVLIQAELLRDSGRLSMAVQDTGPGIPQGYRSRLFSPFEQADGSLVRRHGGTGLGLSLVHGLVSLMGGTLRLVDPQEGGTRFEVELPIAVE